MEEKETSFISSLKIVSYFFEIEIQFIRLYEISFISKADFLIFSILSVAMY
jgi:hypothetical protein